MLYKLVSTQSAEPIFAIVPNKDDDRLPDDCFADKLCEFFSTDEETNGKDPYEMFKELLDIDLG